MEELANSDTVNDAYNSQCAQSPSFCSGDEGPAVDPGECSQDSSDPNSKGVGQVVLNRQKNRQILSRQ